MQEHLATASDHSLVCLFLLLLVVSFVCAHVLLSLSGQVWRQSGRVGLVIEEATEKGASH